MASVSLKYDLVDGLIDQGYAFQDVMPKWEGRIANGIFNELLKGEPYVKFGNTHIITPKLASLLYLRDESKERIFDRDAASPTARRFQDGLGLGLLTTASGSGCPHNHHREIKPFLLGVFSPRHVDSYQNEISAIVQEILEKRLTEGAGIINLNRVLGEITGSVVIRVLLGCPDYSYEDGAALHKLANSGEQYAMRRLPFGAEWQVYTEPQENRKYYSPLLEALVEDSYERALKGTNQGLLGGLITHMAPFASKQEITAQLRNIVIASPGSTTSACFSAFWYLAHTLPLQETIRQEARTGSNNLAMQALYASMLLRPPIPLRAEVAKASLKHTIGTTEFDIEEGDMVVEASLAEGWKYNDGLHPGLFAPTLTSIPEVNRLISPFGKYDHACPGKPLVLLIWSFISEACLRLGNVRLVNEGLPYPETFTALTAVLKENDTSSHYFSIT